MVRRALERELRAPAADPRPDHPPPGDLLDQRSLVDVLRDCEPDEIYNLAAMSFVAASWNQPTLTAEFTGVGVTRLLEAMREVAPRPASTRPPRARCSARCARRRRTSRRRSIRAAPTGSPRSTATSSPSTTARATACTPCSGILFNHESPRRGLEFVTRKVTHGAAAIKLGLADELRARQPRRAPRLGLRARVRRGDVADAAAGRAGGLRDRHRARTTRCASWSRSPSPTSASTRAAYVKQDSDLDAAGRGRPADRRPDQGPRASSAGSRGRASRSWSG